MAAPRTRRSPSGLVPWLSAAALAVSALALLPLGFVLFVAVQTGWATVSALVFRPRIGELLADTALLLACTLPVCAVLAVAVAWLTERTDLPGARVFAWLAVAPLAVPAFVHGYAWASAVPGIHGLGGGVLVSVAAYSALLHLPVAATLRRMDPGLEDAAASLGTPPAAVFLRVVLPQLRLALVGGSLLVGLHLLGEYGLYESIRFDTFTTAIVDQFQSTFNGPAANMMAGVLVLCCLVLLLAEARLRGRTRQARLGGGAARLPVPVRLGRATLPCLAVPVLAAAAFLGVPLVTVGRWLWAGGAAAWNWREIGPALGQTVTLAAAGGLLCTAAALPMAWLSVRRPGFLQRALEAENYVVGSLPGVVVALALVTVTVRVPWIYQTAATVLLAYLLLFLPRAMLGLRASIAQAPAELEQAAASLGHAPLRAVWATTVRLSAPGAAAGLALVSLGIANELTATMMLAPSGTQTLAMQFWSYSGELDYATAAPYALILVLFSGPLVWLLHVQSRRMAGR